MIAFQSGSSAVSASAVHHATSNSKTTHLKENLLTTTTSSEHKKRIKDYVVTITIIVFLQYLCCKYQETFKYPKPTTSATTSTPHLTVLAIESFKMDNRFNIGREVRELKLGSTFAPQNSQTAFHTLKYDFKPASVDLSKVATLDVSSNNQVTVTVPNIESSGVPHTVFKGNQKKYTRECIIIYDKKTGGVTLEKLNHNIQVKKTRSEPAHKAVPPPPQPPKLENNTQRTSSKTRVSTGVRKNTIISFPRSSPMQQGSPSYPHKSPQSAPAWNANSGQSTLPSIPIIGMDDDIDMMPNSAPAPMTTSTSSSNEFQQPHRHQSNQPPPPPLQQPQQQQQQQQQQHYHHHHHNSLPAINIPSTNVPNPVSNINLDNEVGVLSSSDSSSDTESSGSGSDSDDSDNPPQKNNMHHSSQQSLTQHHQPFQNGSLPGILHDDLQLSESNSDSD